jgi:predicted O-linked N-acetylglucosamine transferase (SPINDLY family)
MTAYHAPLEQGLAMTLLDRARRMARQLLTADGVKSDGAGEAQAMRLVDEGNALMDARRFDEAHRCYVAALEAAPGLARAHLNMGNLMLAGGDVQAAIASYGQALSLKPDYAAAHYNLGNAQARQRQLVSALASYERALELQPDFVDAEVAQANTLDDLREYDAAVASYQRALQLRPDYSEVYYNLINVLRKLRRLDEAESICRQALALDPELAEAHNALGVVLLEQRDLSGALAAFRRAVAAKTVFGGPAAQAYHCANQLCDWGDRTEDETALAKMVAGDTPGIAPFGLINLQLPQDEVVMLQRQAARNYAELTLGAYLAAPCVLDVDRPANQGRLRIAYLSADFHEHATMHLLRGVLQAHDKSGFEIFAYSHGSTDDAVTAQVRQHCDVFRDVSDWSNADAAGLMVTDGIDILVDLKGFTKDSRLEISAQRPAPITVSWLGYPGSLGHPGLADYIIGDPVVTPPEHAAHFSETLALMPHCYQPNDRQRVIGARPTRAEAGLPDTGFVFCSFNQNFKFNPQTLDVWCRLLNAVPGSVLWLLPTSEVAMANLRREAALRGVDAQRLIFTTMLPLSEHLGRLQLADLALDTFPYNSHTTGSDALWTGVPLVSLCGSTFASRVAASLLNAVHLPELVTTDWEGYFSLAKELATDPVRLSALRHKLMEGRLSAPLFDTVRFTRNLERLYRAMHQQQRAGLREVIVLRDD